MAPAKTLSQRCLCTPSDIDQTGCELSLKGHNIMKLYVALKRAVRMQRWTFGNDYPSNPYTF